MPAGCGNLGGSSKILSATTLVPFREPSFYLQPTSSKAGIFTTANSDFSTTGMQEWYFDPYTMGGRIHQIASCYNEFSVRSLQFRFIPLNPFGVTNNAGAAASSTRVFAVNWISDPNINSNDVTYLQIMSNGGATLNEATGKPFVYRVPRRALARKWCLCFPSGSTPSVPELRQIMAGTLVGAYESTPGSTAAGPTMVVMAEGVLALRGPRLNSEVTVDMSAYLNQIQQGVHKRQSDEKHSDEKSDCVRLEQEDLVDDDVSSVLSVACSKPRSIPILQKMLAEVSTKNVHK